VSLYRFYGYRQVRGLLTDFGNFVTLSRDSFPGSINVYPVQPEKIFFSGKNIVKLHVIHAT